jgi:predicted secreted Zn-dependent protease
MLLAITPARALVREKLAYAYYDIEVRPGQRVMPAMRGGTPLGMNGNSPVLGRHDGQVRWSYSHTIGEDRACRIDGSTVDLVATIRLPQLRGADAKQQAGFASFIDKLRTHELGHYAIAREEAQATDHVLRSLPAARDCQALYDLAVERTGSVRRRYIEKQAQFDREEGRHAQDFWPDF